MEDQQQQRDDMATDDAVPRSGQSGAGHDGTEYVQRTF